MRLHGRTGELDTLVHHLELAASGRAQLALLEGEAGMGKTRLVDETMTLARKRGFQVFHGRVEELERTRPFGAFADALHCHRRSKDPARAAVGGLLTGEIGDGLRAPASQFRVIDAFVELCERLTTGGPVLLALEDLHWADPTTLLTVRATVRQLAQAPVMLVGTYRPTPQRPEMARLVEVSAEEGACLLRLMPLPREAVIALVTECAGAVPGPRLCGQLDRTGGSPLYALELIKSLDEQAALQRVDGQVEAEETELPATLRLTILRRLRGLPEATVELLRLASILGSALSLTDLSRLAKRPAVELLPAVREARAAGVLGESGGQLAFRHDLVREAIYTDLPLPVRQALHHDFGQALAAAGGPPVRVATHLALGATVGDDQAVRWLRQAAREAGPRAPGVAAELLGRAVDLIEPTHPKRDRVLVEQIVALGWAGKQRDSEKLAREILERPHDPAVEGRVRLHLSRTLVMYTQASDALAVIAATDLASLTAAESAQLRAIGAWACTACGDLDGALTAAEASRAEAERLGDDTAWCIAAAVVAIVGIYRGDVAEAVRIATEVVRRADGVPTPDTRRMTCYHTVAISLTEADRLEEAAAAINRFRGAAEAAGGTWTVPRLYYASIARRFVAGEWDDAIAESEALLSMDVAIGHIVLPVVLSMLAMICLHRGDLDGAETHIVKGEQTLAECGRHPRTSRIAWARGLLYEAHGLIGPAMVAHEESWEQATELGVVAEYPRLAPDLVRVALANDRRGRARAVTEATERIAARMGTPSATAAALRCRGLVTGDPELLLRAVESVRGVSRPLEHGATCAEGAVLLGVAGRVSEARALFDEAVRTYEKLGARYDLDRVAAAMRSVGMRKGARGSRQRPACGWESLTATELRVVACAAEGLTNREIAYRLFISHHTVATHLAHIFGKLGVGSRVELAAEAARRGETARMR